MATRIITLNESGGSPKSEQSQTRYSTPVSELDDHRHHSSTRPRGDTVNSKRGQVTPLGTSERAQYHSGLLQVNESLREPGAGSRGNESAIIDDDGSVHGGHVIEHQGPHSPAIARAGTLRRSRNPINRSRDSSPSDRTPSPADSVAAFADGRRRERRNTVDSRISDLDIGVQRTISGESQCHRPSLTNLSIRGQTNQDDRASKRAAEEDVCFRTSDEPSKT